MKRAAAAQALSHVENGMRLGLGTGSTATHFVALLGERVAAGLAVLCVPTSERTRLQAQALGIPLTTLDDTPRLDLTVDGADELDAGLTLIKGGGGALLREKIVAMASDQMIVIADDTKVVDRLGRFPLPVEVNPFGLRATKLLVSAACAAQAPDALITLRLTAAGIAYVTDGGHFILDCALGKIEDATRLEQSLLRIPGVVETGLFITICRRAYVASMNGVALHAVPS